MPKCPTVTAWSVLNFRANLVDGTATTVVNDRAVDTNLGRNTTAFANNFATRRHKTTFDQITERNPRLSARFVGASSMSIESSA